MNENNFNGMQNMNQQPVAPVTPQVSVAPTQQPVGMGTPVQPMVQQAPVAPKQPMDKSQILKYVGMGTGLAVALSVFVPYVSVLGYGVSIWENSGKFNSIVFILFGVIAALTYFFGKAKRFSLLAGGTATWYSLMLLESADWSFSYFSFGFWLMLLGGIGLVVVNVLENMDEIKSLFGTSGTAAPAVQPVPTAPVQPMTMPTTVAPTMPTVEPQAPVMPTVEPVVQAAVVCTNCGQPKKNPMDQFCQSCGQRY